jgi:hypothetical protein
VTTVAAVEVAEGITGTQPLRKIANRVNGMIVKVCLDIK